MDEEPENIDVDGKDFHFLFLIDRSGSMSGSYIRTAREALKLFIQSLPMDCTFSICSFGSNFTIHTDLNGSSN